MSNETQVDHSQCAANCGMLATNSRSTNGEGQWLCFIHFANEPRDWHLITHELRRLAWLVDVVRALRAGANLTSEQQQSFAMAQRKDLQQKESEWPRSWMIRLEGVLAQSCKDSVVQS